MLDAPSGSIVCVCARVCAGKDQRYGAVALDCRKAVESYSTMHVFLCQCWLLFKCGGGALSISSTR